MPDLPSARPLRDLFDAAVRGRGVKLICRACGHSAILSSHALWWRFERRGWRDGLADVPKRCLCLMCLRHRRRRIRGPVLELVLDPPSDLSLPMPPELDWKRALTRRR